MDCKFTRSGNAVPMIVCTKEPKNYEMAILKKTNRCRRWEVCNKCSDYETCKMILRQRDKVWV